ncbi:MAG: class II fumarate hydratase [bacterium]|nr:class II fumarate hydratase [bacterium]
MYPFRELEDSLGKVLVPREALYAAQTQRAVENFPIGHGPLPKPLIYALAQIKQAAASVARKMGLQGSEKCLAIEKAAAEVLQGKWDDQFPVDLFQTGSGTSSNMNVNEVIAHRAAQITGIHIHPNDNVNFGQSSNDVVPTAIHLAVLGQAAELLEPALAELTAQLDQAAQRWGSVVKTGRTHLMDALPVTLGQVFGGFAQQLRTRQAALEKSLSGLYALPLGGTAVGSGLNAPPGFAAQVAAVLGQQLDRPLYEAENHFAQAGNLDALAEVMGQLKGLALALLKLCNDLRWMNSGPQAGLGEIRLAELQPGSSIMPGKVNPVVEESTAMICVQVVGFEAAFTLAASQSNFELSVMLPLAGYNLLESIRLLSAGISNLARRSIAQLQPNLTHLAEQAGKNPLLATVLNPLVGYDKAAEIVKEAYRTGQSVKAVALQLTDLKPEELDQALNPLYLTGYQPK